MSNVFVTIIVICLPPYRIPMASDEDIQVLQSEELEVLKSIYEGDQAFSAMSDTHFQYKFGDDGDKKSFLLDVR
jgi:hypothetical protein